MTVKETIIQSIRDYPSISPNRYYVLCHLFCHYGTGYEWENGELVYPPKQRAEELKRPRTTDKVLEELEKKWPETKTNPAFKLLYESKEAEQRIAANAESLAEPSAFHSRPDWRFLLSKEYSPLFNLPRDIKPDWLEAAREVEREIALYDASQIQSEPRA